MISTTTFLWSLGGCFTVMGVLIGVIFGSINSRINKIEDHGNGARKEIWKEINANKERLVILETKQGIKNGIE